MAFRSLGTAFGERLRVSGAMATRLASSISPILMGSKRLVIEMSFCLGEAMRGASSECLAEVIDESPDGVFTAAIERPLADAVDFDQARLFECGEVGGDGGLGKPAALFELVGADAHIKRMRLGREVALRFAHPFQKVQPGRVGQSLEAFASAGFGVNIVHFRYVYRRKAI